MIAKVIDKLISHAVLTSGCACPGDTLTYKCTVVGGILGGATVWKGTAFDCPLNEIALLHPRFTSAIGTYGVCNSGAIVARSFSVEGNNYTSQLNVTFTSDIAGETIMCVHDTISSNIIQLSAVIPTTGNIIILLVVNVVKLLV